MSAKGFAGIPLEKLGELEKISDRSRKAILADWAPGERAIAKFALSYIGSKLTMNKQEVKYVAKLLKRSPKSKDTLLHTVQLHYAGAIAAGDLLTGAM